MESAGDTKAPLCSNKEHKAKCPGYSVFIRMLNCACNDSLHYVNSAKSNLPCFMAYGEDEHWLETSEFWTTGLEGWLKRTCCRWTIGRPPETVRSSNLRFVCTHLKRLHWRSFDWNQRFDPTSCNGTWTCSFKDSMWCGERGGIHNQEEKEKKM